MKRRDFIALIGSAAVTWPLAAGAQQQPAKVARLGYLAAASNPDLVEALRGELRDLGYVQVRTLQSNTGIVKLRRDMVLACHIFASLWP